MEFREELEAREARRWRALVATFLEWIPELGPEYDDDGPLESPSDVSTALQLRFIDLRRGPRFLDSDLWPRILGLLEVVEEALVLMHEQEAAEEDLVQLTTFANSSVLCAVVRNQEGLESLLPLMGPLTVEEARAEVSYHVESRGFDETHIDWSRAATRFAPVNIDPSSLLPVDEDG